ncbi:pilus assembly protein TadG-related protein [Eubacteriaceae bacterium ES2]|nr:pilus assembly protein TadG-related protein [Eubacteriaceae bacterium ES2]
MKLIKRLKELCQFNEETGDALIIVAFSMVFIMGFLALVIDLGLAYLSTGQQQKAADAAVYSAGRLLPIETGDTIEINNIKQSALLYADLNGFSDLSFANVQLENTVNGMYTQIRVTVEHQVPMNFAKLFGIDSINISRSAVAKLSPIIRTTGVAPIGLTKEEMEWRIASNQLTHVTLKYGVQSDTTSFFGALDLDGQGGGAKDYALWITNGYDGEISVGDILLEESGNMVGPTYEGFEARYSGCTHYGAETGGEGCTVDLYDLNCSRIVKVPVYSFGLDKKTVVVEGFAAFLLENQTNDGYITGSFLNMVSNGAASGYNVGEGSEGDFGVYNLILAE